MGFGDMRRGDDDDVLDYELIRAICASGARPVDLPTILERIDSNQRWVPTHAQLAGGLRRAGDAGSIRETAPGTYVDAGRTTVGGPVTDLSAEAYEQAVRDYHHAFTADVVRMNSSLMMRLTTRLFEAAYRLSGGRFGVEPGVVDLDGVSLGFMLDESLEPLGWSCESAQLADRVRRIEVIPRGPGESADREQVRLTVDRVVRDGQFGGRHQLVFPDGDELRIGPP